MTMPVQQNRPAVQTVTDSRLNETKEGIVTSYAEEKADTWQATEQARPSSWAAHEEQLERLSKSIDVLADQIRPVLAPDYPTINAVERPDSEGSEFEQRVEGLRRLAYRIEQLTARVVL